MKSVTVDITDRGAIYVDGTRITNRNTKWGVHQTVDSFVCNKADVVTECVRRGFPFHIRNIDDESYVAQTG